MTPSLPYYRPCHHRRDLSLIWTLTYCLCLSTTFVISLYLFVPSSVRKLSRDDASHVKWRIAIVLFVSAASVVTYPWLFCENYWHRHYYEPLDDSPSSRDDFGGRRPWFAYLGFAHRPMQDLRIGCHVLCLYLGPLSCTFLSIYHHGRSLRCRGGGMETEEAGGDDERSPPRRPLPIYPGFTCLYRSFVAMWMRPKFASFEHFATDVDEYWTTIRNLLAAPIAEEIVFRACLLPPLLSCDGGYSTTTTCWIAPLFFGVAHLHHLIEQCRRHSISPIAIVAPPASSYDATMVRKLLLGSAFQWTYTTLFGAYASHVFVRTGSILSSIVAHVVCNYMGLPDLRCLSSDERSNRLHGYRPLIASMYLLGMYLFVRGFDPHARIFPTVSVLPHLLHPGEM